MNVKKIIVLILALILLVVLLVVCNVLDARKVAAGESQRPNKGTEVTEAGDALPAIPTSSAPTETEPDVTEATQAPTKPMQKPTEKPTEAPTEKPTEKPTETPTEKPTEKPTETPTEKPTNHPTEATGGREDEFPLTPIG